MAKSRQNMSLSPVSIIIPAHNEESCIRDTLETLTEGMDPERVQVLVSCNGCNDNTAQIARQYPVQVLDIAEASKIAALNEADKCAQYFPRIYMDADVLLTQASVEVICQALNKGGIFAASPQAHYVLESSSWAVRAFYEVWMLHPVFDTGMVGCGVYALSQEGRARFEEFPNITADDCFVRSQFAEHERVMVREAQATLFPPLTLKQLFAIKTRSRRGTAELKQKFPDLKPTSSKSRFLFWQRLFKRPELWLKAMAYIYVVLEASRRSKQSPSSGQWEKDLSSRERAHC
ncbi:MAG: glycosyltransferase [Planctomycetes bacterium]|nr:glycosyltransferase [Planctomycetota bacterium]